MTFRGWHRHPLLLLPLFMTSISRSASRMRRVLPRNGKQHPHSNAVILFVCSRHTCEICRLRYVAQGLLQALQRPLLPNHEFCDSRVRSRRVDFGLFYGQGLVLTILPDQRNRLQASDDSPAQKIREMTMMRWRRPVSIEHAVTQRLYRFP